MGAVATVDANLLPAAASHRGRHLAPPRVTYAASSLLSRRRGDVDHEPSEMLTAFLHTWGDALVAEKDFRSFIWKKG
jgi:hypothetical protein